jgi:hypothetical protein
MKRKLLSITFVMIAMVFMISFSQDVLAQTQRNPVLEYCTGTWCVYCPQGHTIIQNDILPNIPNAIIIGYHGPANGSDPFSFFPGNTILSLFGFNAYPTGIVDRKSGIQSRSAWYGLMNTRNSVPATVAIDMERSFNKTTREFSATIDFTALTNLNGQYNFNVILLESGMVWAQTGGTTDYVHHHVARAMMNGASGQEVINGAWNQNDVITKSVNYTVPVPGGSGPDIIWDSCNVVVLVYKVGSPLSSNAEIQQAVEMTLISPDFVATIASTSPDIIGDNNMPGEFTSVIENIGLLNDTYNISCTLNGPANWSGEFTTINGTFAFGEMDSVQVATGNSTDITVNINPSGFSGSGEATLNFQSKNNPGNVGNVTLRLVTTTGNDILVVDASEEGYGEYVANSLENVFPGTVGIVSRNAINPTVVLDYFQMISWSASNTLPAFLPDEVDALQGYLDGGGKLFINGQDIGSDVFGSGGQSQFAQSFYNNYLHASFVGPGNFFFLKGVPGDPITDGKLFVINDIYPRSPDKIAPYDASASAIFTYVDGPDIAGIKAAANDYKVVYFGFGFEQIPADSILLKNTLLSKIINYFDVEPMILPSAPVLVSPANSEVIDSSSVLFVWQQSLPEVSKYSIELDTTDQFSSPIVNSDITDTTYLFTGLITGKNYWWRVRAFNSNGWGNFSDVRTFSTLIVGVDDESQIPTKFRLEQNYPNPFNPSTTIAYSIPKESQVSLKIYDVMGREVVEVMNGRQSAGDYNVEFGAASLASGTYFYKLTAGEFISVKKMVLLK